MPRVSAKRQITLPIEQCREVGIEPGDEYRSYVADGRITIVRKSRRSCQGNSAPRRQQPHRQRRGIVAGFVGRADSLIAADTNVLLRYLLQDDRQQTERANAVFDAAKTVLITDVVLAEAVWTLSGRKYGLAKAELVGAIERLFSEPNIRFEDDQVVWRALQAYRCVGSAGEPRPVKGAGFADALIVFKALRTASDAGETLTDVYTFDTAMQRLPHTASP